MDEKNDQINLRISGKEKEEMFKTAKKEGFDSLSSFILWLYRQFKKKEG